MKKEKILELLHRMPNEIKEMDLEKNEVSIYNKLLSIADDDGWCYVTVNSLANELHYKTSTVLSFTKLLENKKIITQRIIGNRYTRTRFKLNLFLPNTNSSSNNSTEEDTNCSNSSIKDLINIKLNDLMNEIEKLNNLTKLYIASNKNSDDFEFNLKISVSPKNDKDISRRVGAFKNDELVFAFKSISEVESNGFDTGNVLLCCNGIRKTHKGFEWRYI